jgi:hypothetical protein
MRWWTRDRRSEFTRARHSQVRNTVTDATDEQVHPDSGDREVVGGVQVGVGDSRQAREVVGDDRVRVPRRPRAEQIGGADSGDEHGRDRGAWCGRSVLAQHIGLLVRV